MKPFAKTHANFEQLVLLNDTDGTSTGTKGAILAVDRDQIESGKGTFVPFSAFAPGTVAPQLFDFLQCAPLLYQQLTRQYASLQIIADKMEEGGMPANNPLLVMIANMQDAVLLSQAAARDGIMKASAAIDREEERLNRK